MWDTASLQWLVYALRHKLPGYLPKSIYLFYSVWWQILVLLVILKHVTVMFDDYILFILVKEVWICIQRQTKDKKSEEGHKPAAYGQEKKNLSWWHVYKTPQCVPDVLREDTSTPKKHRGKTSSARHTTGLSYLIHAKPFQKHLTCTKHYCKHLIMNYWIWSDE